MDSVSNLVAGLQAIASLGGNLPDNLLTTRTGPNDAAYRGQMYCSARAIAQDAISRFERADEEEDTPCHSINSA
jgi:hypothetical protein